MKKITINEYVFIFMLLGMLLAGFLVGKHLYYDMTYNSVVKIINHKIAEANLGLCYLPDAKETDIYGRFNFTEINFTLTPEGKK